MEIHIEPTSRELLAIIGCLWSELDDLRERVASAPVSFNRRVFTNRELASGASLGISGHVLPNGNIVIVTNS